MNKILFIDILTTGLNPQKCGIYAIGGILCEDTQSVIRETKRFEFRLRPSDGARIIDNSLWLGGITRSHLLYYQREDEVLKAFVDIMSEAVNSSDPEDKIFICGFNCTTLDMPFLKEWYERNGNKRFRDCFHMQTIDLMSIATYALMSERHTMREFNLSTVSRKLGIVAKTSEHYACMDNVETCIQIYRKLKERLGRGEGGEHLVCDESVTNFNQKA